MSINRSCLQCKVPFETSMMRRLFCSNGCERDHWREHGLECYYCDETAESEDHIFLQHYGDGCGETVPACRECNSVLQDCSPTSHIGRMKTLLDRYLKRYKKVLNYADWTEDELAEVSENLRQSIEVMQAQKVRAHTRITFLWDRIKETAAAQEDLEDGCTETEDFEPGDKDFGYLPKDTSH